MIGHHEGGIEADAELADECWVFARLAGLDALDEGACAGVHLPVVFNCAGGTRRDRPWLDNIVTKREGNKGVGLRPTAREVAGTREVEKALTALGRGDAGGTSRKPLETRDNLNFFRL